MIHTHRTKGLFHPTYTGYPSHRSWCRRFEVRRLSESECMLRFLNGDFLCFEQNKYNSDFLCCIWILVQSLCQNLCSENLNCVAIACGRSNKGQVGRIYMVWLVLTGRSWQLHLKSACYVRVKGVTKPGGSKRNLLTIITGHASLIINNLQQCVKNRGIFSFFSFNRIAHFRTPVFSCDCWEIVSTQRVFRSGRWTKLWFNTHSRRYWASGTRKHKKQEHTHSHVHAHIGLDSHWLRWARSPALPNVW